MTFSLKQTIVLIGLMGAGKTSIGKRLAGKLGQSFVDVDQEIEKKEGKTVTQIFEQNGEDYFREAERNVIKQFLVGKPHIMATGGGAFTNEETRKLIKEKAISLWLRADLETLVERVSRRNTRPLLEKGDKREIMQKLMEQRYPVYAEADLVVESTEGPHDKVVNEIIWKLNEFTGKHS